MKRNKSGISLIVLVITMIVPYYETLKASKIEEIDFLVPNSDYTVGAYDARFNGII